MQQIEKKSYICPYCKKRQTSIIKWQTASISYNYDIKTEEWKKDEEIVGDLESYNCPNCEGELPYNLIENFI